MRMRKALALLAALMMAGALASCGKESSETVEESSVAETTVAETTTAESSEEESSEEEKKPAEPKDLGPVDKNAITFEDGNLFTAEAVADSGAAPIELSVVEYQGNKKLLVHVLKAEGKEDADYEVPKIKFDLPALLGAENVGKIGHISVDMYCNALENWVNDDGSESLVVGNFLGALGGNIAGMKAYDKEGNLIQSDWANHYEFKCDDWENPTNEWRIETDIPALLPSNGYASLDGEYYDADGNPLDPAEVCAGQNLFIMRWGQKNSVDFYIDNLTFYDKDGNSMAIVGGGDAAEEETEEEPEVVDAEAETTAPEESPAAEEAPTEESSEEAAE